MAKNRKCYRKASHGKEQVSLPLSFFTYQLYFLEVTTLHCPRHPHPPWVIFPACSVISTYINIMLAAPFLPSTVLKSSFWYLVMAV